jgi:hypothetical protein
VIKWVVNLAKFGRSYIVLSALTSEGLIKPDTGMTVFHLYIITSMSLIPTFSEINLTLVQHLPSYCYYKSVAG